MLRRGPGAANARASSAAVTAPLGPPEAAAGSHMWRGPTLKRPLEALEEREEGAEERGVTSTAPPRPPPWLNVDVQESMMMLDGPTSPPKLEGAGTLRVLRALSWPLLSRLIGPLGAWLRGPLPRLR